MPREENLDRDHGEWWLPGKALVVRPGLQAEGAIDPGGAAISEGGPVVGLAPDQQSAGGPLETVAIFRIVVLVLEAGANDVRNQVMERLETQHELAAWLGSVHPGRRQDRPDQQAKAAQEHERRSDHTLSDRAQRA